MLWLGSFLALVLVSIANVYAFVIRSYMRSYRIRSAFERPLARLFATCYVLLMSDYQLRLAAAAKGEKTYQGRQCAQGHGGTRYTSNSVCVECMKAKAAARSNAVRDLLKRNAQ